MFVPADLKALLESCKEALDDAPRRALADWLADHGDADRAEFVRLQLLPNHPGEAWLAGGAAAKVREWRLLRRLAPEWAGGYFSHSGWLSLGPDWDVADEVEPTPAQGKFQRGTLKLCASVEQLPELLTRLPGHALPWLEALDCHDLGDECALRELLGHPAAGQFTSFELSWREGGPLGFLDWLDRERTRGLSLGDQQTDTLMRRVAALRALRPHQLSVSPQGGSIGGWEALAASPVLSEVRSLECGIPSKSPALSLLARAPHLNRLTRLHLSGDDFPAPALRALFAAPGLQGLTDLHVGGYSGNIGGITAAALAASPLRRLERLELGSNAIGDDEARALARSPAVASLRRLSFASGRLSEGAALALAESTLLGDLEALDLSCTGIGDRGVIALARSPNLSRLRSLSVCRCGMTERGLSALAASPYLGRLEDLDLSLNELPPKALDVLASSTWLGNLRCLGLRRLAIDPGSFTVFLRSPAARRLERLDLQGAPLYLAHVKALAEAPLEGLRELVLYNNAIPPGLIDHLAQAPWLSNLVSLNLHGTGLGDAGVEPLARHLRPGGPG
jgi:uncharacterized protein (TIGR02996 family)